MEAVPGGLEVVVLVARPLVEAQLEGDLVRLLDLVGAVRAEAVTVRLITTVPVRVLLPTQGHHRHVEVAPLRTTRDPDPPRPEGEGADERTALRRIATFEDAVLATTATGVAREAEAVITVER